MAARVSGGAERLRQAVHGQIGRLVLWARRLCRRHQEPRSVADGDGANRGRGGVALGAEEERVAEWSGWEAVRRELAMRTLDLWRMRENDFATYGRIEDEEHREMCKTIERPWVDADKNGKRDRNVSRFVGGNYLFRRVDSPKHGDCFEGVDIPDVDDAQIHVACLPRDLKGCIGVGTAFGPVQYPDMQKPEPGVVNSRVAFKAFMAELEGVDEFLLRVHDIPPRAA